MKEFEIYDKENPSVWVKFREKSFETIRKGFSHYSAKGIFEVLRWHEAGEEKDDGFKVNNNYTAYYARKFMDKFPQHEGFFRTKSLLG